MAGPQWISGGSGEDTSRMVCWCHLDPPKLPPGGQKWPENAIKQIFLAIVGSGGSKWMDLSGSWLDLGGIHLRWSVGAIWTHQNWPQGPPGGSEMDQKCIFGPFLPM